MTLIRNQHGRIAAHPKLNFWSIYPLSMVFVFHTLLVAYINSTFMEQHLTAEGVGALYTIGSAIAVISFLFFSHALKAIGNVKLTIILAIIDLLSLLVLGATEVRATAIVAFVTFLVVNPLLYLNIDIFTETLIGKDESNTGSKRGMILGVMSLSAVIAPLLMGWLVGDDNDLNIVYFVAAGIFAIFIVLIIAKFRNFQDPNYDVFEIRSSIREMWLHSDVRNVMFSHLLLQMFFAWAVIYIPLYLATVMDFGWDQISYMVAFALLAYLFLEWPIGILADKYFGEKEIMAIGFLILAVTVSWISFMTSTEIWPWMLLLFLTRVGAAMIEVTTEVYFFKHTDGEDADIIGFFRLLRPLASVFGALLGSAALLYLPFNLIFVVFGLLLVPGIFFTIKLEDTK